MRASEGELATAVAEGTLTHGTNRDPEVQTFVLLRQGLLTIIRLATSLPYDQDPSLF